MDPSIPQVPVAEPTPGCFVVRYDSVEDMQPVRQQRLLEQVRQRAAAGVTGIVFVLAPQNRLVPVEVPTFWLSITGDASYRLAAMAIVTRSIAVRAAVKGFALANLVRGLELKVDTFDSEPAALDWVRGELARRAPPGR